MAAPAEQTKTDQTVIRQEGSMESLESVDDDEELETQSSEEDAEELETPAGAQSENGEDDDAEEKSKSIIAALRSMRTRGSKNKNKFAVAMKKRGAVQKLKRLLCSVVIYFGAVAALFCSLEKWTVGESLYFATVVVTTVGYGDFLPKSDGSKIATIICVLFGLSIVVQAFNILQNVLVSKASAEAHFARKKLRYQHKKGIFHKAEQKKLKGAKQVKSSLIRGRKLMYIILLDILFIAMGTVVFAFDFAQVEERGCGNCILDGLYLSVITITTVGFGDLAPVSPGGHAFAMFFMLVGIPIQVAAFSMISNALFPAIKAPLRITKIRGTLTAEKFATINDFVEVMRKGGLDKKHHHQTAEAISRFEFLSFMLVQNGAVSLKNVKTCMKNFEKLDRSNKGFISKEDIGVHTGYHHHPQRHQDEEECEEATGKERMETV